MWVTDDAALQQADLLEAVPLLMGLWRELWLDVTESFLSKKHPKGHPVTIDVFYET